MINELKPLIVWLVILASLGIGLFGIFLFAYLSNATPEEAYASGYKWAINEILIDRPFEKSLAGLFPAPPDDVNFDLTIAWCQGAIAARIDAANRGLYNIIGSTFMGDCLEWKNDPNMAEF